MSWTHDQLAPVDSLLFRGNRVKIGRFDCEPEDPCFGLSAALDNDVFVLPQLPVWLRRNDGDFRFVEPGAILMHRAGQTLARRKAAMSGDRTYWFGVHPEIFANTFRRHGLPADEMGGALIVDARFCYRLALFLKQFESGQLESAGIESAVLGFFREICRQRAIVRQRTVESRMTTDRRQRRLVDAARAYLDAHLSESISLATVADATGTSLYHLCRVFRDRMGITMHAYRTRQRLWHVLNRLVEGDGADLSALAFDQGFSSHSHLCRVFQKQIGVPPSSVRSISLAVS